MKIAFTYCLLLISIQSFAQKTSLSFSLDSLIQYESNRNNFSGAVMVIENDKIILSKSVGFADINKQIKNELSTKFNIASVGKLFTKVVILQLVAEGKIKLNEPVSKFYNSFDSPPLSQITIADLMNHKAGLRDVYVNKEYINLVENNVPDFQDKVVSLISKEELRFIPGTDTKYSNSGYYLLGAVASKIDNKSFADVINDRIFIPLEMNNSGFAKTGDFVPGHAKPYEFKWWGWRISEVETGLMGDRPSGAGSQYATVQDLTKLYLSILNDNVLLSDTLKAILFNGSENLDWTEIKNSGRIIGYVGGDTRGWSAKIGFYFLENKTYGVVIASNFDNMAHELDLKMRPYIIESSKKP